MLLLNAIVQAADCSDFFHLLNFFQIWIHAVQEGPPWVGVLWYGCNFFLQGHFSCVSPRAKIDANLQHWAQHFYNMQLGLLFENRLYNPILHPLGINRKVPFLPTPSSQVWASHPLVLFLPAKFSSAQFTIVQLSFEIHVAERPDNMDKMSDKGQTCLLTIATS